MHCALANVSARSGWSGEGLPWNLFTTVNAFSVGLRKVRRASRSEKESAVRGRWLRLVQASSHFRQPRLRVVSTRTAAALGAAFAFASFPSSAERADAAAAVEVDSPRLSKARRLSVMRDSIPALFEPGSFVAVEEKGRVGVGREARAQHGPRAPHGPRLPAPDPFALGPDAVRRAPRTDDHQCPLPEDSGPTERRNQGPKDPVPGEPRYREDLSAWETPCLPWTARPGLP